MEGANEKVAPSFFCEHSGETFVFPTPFLREAQCLPEASEWETASPRYKSPTEEQNKKPITTITNFKKTL